MSGTHVFATNHKDAPNAACHRALVLNPFTCKAQCEQKGIPYNCCKIPDHQMRPTKLVETITTDTVTAQSSLIKFKVCPSLKLTAISTMPGGPFSGGSTQLENADGSTFLSSYSAYRCVAMGLEVEPTESVMDIAGKIAMAPSPWYPYPINQFGSDALPESISEVQRMEGAIVVGSKDSAHCAWTPDSNGITYANAVGVSGSPDTMTTYQIGWRYTDFVPLGYNSSGAKVTSLASSTDPLEFNYGSATGPQPRTQLMYNVPGIVCVINTGSTAAATYNITIVQHWELIALVRGTGLGPGSLGKHVKAHRGLVSAVIGEAQAAWHELTKVAGVGEKVLSGAWHVGKDVAKIAGLVGSVLAL